MNLVQVNWPKIRRREADWQLKALMLFCAAAMALVAPAMMVGAMIGEIIGRGEMTVWTVHVSVSHEVDISLDIS